MPLPPTDAATETAAAQTALQSQSLRWRLRLTEQRAVLRENYFKKPDAAPLLHGHRLLIDRQLQAVWRQLAMPPQLALIAIGGYGRGELYPYSDIDLLILLPAAAPAEMAGRIEQFVGVLWDIGLEVGHSVRTVEQCIALAQQDVTVQTGLLETRLVTGERKLFTALSKAAAHTLDPQKFYQAKLLEQEQRHARYHDTNLEPNLKESAGGLRDLHNMAWIAKAAGIGTRWSDLVRYGILLRSEALQLKLHETFLQNLRIRLHYLAQRHEDRLIFEVQTELAESMHYRPTAERRASERLMQEFYLTANEVRQLNIVVLQNIGATLFQQRTQTTQKISDDFQIHNELLEATDENLFQLNPGALFEAFLLLQQRPELKGMTAGTLRALWRARENIGPTFRRDPANRARFMEILRAPERVIRTLRRMHEYGVLGRYIAAFGRVTGQMQHDLYHVYTVDEHILKVVRNLRRFAVPEFSHEFPLCSRLMDAFGQPELLYLAGLFHDIAKGRGGDHSALGKVDALRFCREHGLTKADAELVAWLVESHLVMSATAQKQDLSDPNVIEAFAQRVGNERRLTALYLLTVADIRGTSPKVWNAWKAKLLEDLFYATRLRLSGDTKPLETSMQQRQEIARARLRLYAINGPAYEKLWVRFDTSYFLRHSADEIAWHTRLLAYRADPTKSVIKARISPAGEGLQVMVYAADRKDLFTRTCAFFERISYSIVEAKIYTTRDNFGLDSFQIIDPNNKRPQYRDLINYIEYELMRSITEETPLVAPMQGRVSRQLKHFPISPEVSISPDERGAYSVLSIVAGDRPGLLSRIARCFVDYGINVHTAKVNTLGDRAEDVFLINGDALNNPKMVVKLESELVQRLQA